MPDVRRHFTRAPWEKKVGYCRAMRSGPMIAVTGTVTDEASLASLPAADAGYRQAKRALEIVISSLRELGAGPEHVIRTRMFVTDISRWEEFGRAHAEVFAAHPPTTSMIEVKALIAPEYLIEIEADAYVPA